MYATDDLYSLWWVDGWDDEADEVRGWGVCLAGPLTAAAAVAQAEWRGRLAEIDHGPGELVVLESATGRRADPYLLAGLACTGQRKAGVLPAVGAA